MMFYAVPREVRAKWNLVSCYIITPVVTGRLKFALICEIFFLKRNIDLFTE